MKNEPIEIINQITHQQIKFIRCDSTVLEMETVYSSFSEEPPMHFHPHQQEYFEVLQGELTVRYDHGIRSYEKGSRFMIKPNDAHAMWNADFMPCKVKWEVTPPKATEKLLRTTFRLANFGKTNSAGRPQVLILFYLLKKYKSTFRLKKPSLSLINLVFIICSPIYYFGNYSKKY